ncbi:MAG: hypothetical protein HYZ00_08200, partial [Candidatus Hydrogenedentes bacterium]|nr:hypothetical protein [Candidatus Hydrogenedentota bacterium]
AAALVLLMLAAWAMLSPLSPDREHEWAREVGRDTLDAVPESGVLVARDPLIYSFLRATQIEEGARDDVFLMPASLLLEPQGRLAISKRLPHEIELPLLFPDAEALERWQQQLPYQFARFSGHPGAGGASDALLEDFALWDLAAANIDHGGVALAGLSPEWLAARASAAGLLLLYPAPEPGGADVPLPTLYTGSDRPNDPDGLRTLSVMLLTLSDQALRQADTSLALLLAHEAGQYTPNDPGPRLAQIRVRARQGQKGAVLAEAESFLRRWPDAPSNDALQQGISENLDRSEAESSLVAFLERSTEQKQDYTARDTVFEALWRQEQFSLLVHGYRAILEGAPRDLDALYQLAAAYAQLGQWEQADECLGQWVTTGNVPLPEVLRQLKADGRFAHFHTYRRHTYLPPQFQG